jgi:RNA polymerase sigma-70 factor (ECF subfamily)
MLPTQPTNPTSADDRTVELVGFLRAGDGGAGALLNALYREPIHRFCWGYLGRADEAEDVWQEICYRVLTAKRIPDSFRAWLYKIARNQCLNALRTRANRRDGAPIVAESQVQDVLTGHLTRLVKEEVHSQLASLVDSLSPEQREALRLRYVEDLSRSEIAQVLDLPESVVKSRIFEGLKRLREHASVLEKG